MSFQKSDDSEGLKIRNYASMQNSPSQGNAAEKKIESDRVGKVSPQLVP